MAIVKAPNRRHFTDAARAAAKEARRRKREQALGLDCPEVFVVRRSDDERLFAWEIRRFGAVTLDRSRTSFRSAQDARTDGLRALSSFTILA